MAGGARTRPKGVHSAGTPRRRRRGRCEDAGRPLRIVDSLLPRHQLVKKSFYKPTDCQSWQDMGGESAMEYLTVKETAQRWGVSVRTVNMHLNDGPRSRARCARSTVGSCLRTRKSPSTAAASWRRRRAARVVKRFMPIFLDDFRGRGLCRGGGAAGRRGGARRRLGGAPRFPRRGGTGDGVGGARLCQRQRRDPPVRALAARDGRLRAWRCGVSCRADFAEVEREGVGGGGRRGARPERVHPPGRQDLFS